MVGRTEGVSDLSEIFDPSYVVDLFDLFYCFDLFDLIDLIDLIDVFYILDVDVPHVEVGSYLVSMNNIKKARPLSNHIMDRWKTI